MNDDARHELPVDLRALDPARDLARFDALVGAITVDAMAARGAAAEQAGVFAALAGWSRPALGAASLVLAVSLPTLWRASAHTAPATLPRTDTMGIPRELALILHSSRPPTIAELHEAVFGTSAP
jgi:hypothetical protein